jgi:hypothetical protein
MPNERNSMLHSVIAACLGVAVTFAAIHPTRDESSSNQQIAKLENRIRNLEHLLAQKERALKTSNSWSFDAVEKATSNVTPATSNAPSLSASANEQSKQATQAAADVEQVLKDLATLSYGDSRSFTEKVNDFLSDNPGSESVAIVSKSVFDLAENKDVLSNQALGSIYAEHEDRGLRRVVAQVASMRGDNSLVEMQIMEMQSGLASAQASERQKALVELAKTRYAGAADLAVPLLQDDDIGVKLDALLTLRATGNQSHLRFVTRLVNHPDESVSWLAKDVVNKLQMLSDMARTRVMANDVVAELPPIGEYF